MSGSPQSRGPSQYRENRSQCRGPPRTGAHSLLTGAHLVPTLSMLLGIQTRALHRKLETHLLSGHPQNRGSSQYREQVSMSELSSAHGPILNAQGPHLLSMLLGIQKRALNQSLETQSLAVSPQNRGSPLGTENISKCRAFPSTGAHLKAQGPTLSTLLVVWCRWGLGAFFNVGLYPRKFGIFRLALF